MENVWKVTVLLQVILIVECVIIAVLCYGLYFVHSPNYCDQWNNTWSNFLDGLCAPKYILVLTITCRIMDLPDIVLDYGY